MDFQKKYPLLHLQNEYINIQWTRGYQSVELYHKERLVGSVTGYDVLLEGVQFNDAELGLIELKLSEHPLALNLIVAGFHSPVNASYPTYELKVAARIFWVLASLSIIIGLANGIIASLWAGSLSGTNFLNLVAMLIYTISATMTERGKPWAFYLGAGFHLLLMLILLLMFIFGSNIIVLFLAVFQLIVVVFLSSYLKNANEAHRHRKFEGRGSKLVDKIYDLLDRVLGAGK
jgi:hypothetical protein